MKRADCLLGAVLMAAVGCTQGTGGADAGGGRCTAEFVGDPAAPLEMEVIAMGDGNEVTPVPDGGRVPLMLPPQGGRVAFVGVRARNVDPCTVELAGSFRDPVSGGITLDSRVINLVVLDGGVAQSPRGVASRWTNITACPNQWAEQDLHEQPFQLAVTMRERGGRTTSRTLTVTTFCGEPDNAADCICLCSKDYDNTVGCEASDGGMTRDAGMPGDGGMPGDAG